MDNTSIDYADLAEYDRRQRAIERHLLAAFAGGLAVGLIGIFLSGHGPDWIRQIYDPYAYLALALAVGASASGLGWALLTTFLSAVSMPVAAMAATALRGQDALVILGGSPAQLNWILALLVGLGLLGYVTRRKDTWGDLAAGTVGAALLADVVDRSTPGFIDSEHAFWPGPALAVGLMSVGLVLVLRRNIRGRVRALAMSATAAGLFTIGLAVFTVGWSPLTI